MCQIVVEPAGIMLPRACHENSYSSNDDGFGYMYAENGRVVAFKQVGLSKRKVLKLIRANKHRLFISHMRYRTSGAVSNDLCHPFRVLHKDRDGKDLFLMHNGVISWVTPNGTESDTVAFINRYLKPILKNDPSFLYTSEFKKYVESLIGVHNKLCLLDGDGNVIRTGSWVEYNQCFMSNSSYRPMTQATTPNHVYGSYPTSTHSYNCMCYTCTNETSTYSFKQITSSKSSTLTQWSQAKYDKDKTISSGTNDAAVSAETSTDTTDSSLQGFTKSKEEDESFIAAKEADLIVLDTKMSQWDSLPVEEKEEILNVLDVRNIHKYKRFPAIWKALQQYYTTYAKYNAYPDLLLDKSKSQIKNWLFNHPWHTIWGYLWLLYDGSCDKEELDRVFFNKGWAIFQQHNVRYKEPIVFAINYSEFFELFYNDIASYGGVESGNEEPKPLTSMYGA